MTVGYLTTKKAGRAERMDAQCCDTISSRQHLAQLRSPDDTIRSDDPLAGCILWLPRKDQMDPRLASVEVLVDSPPAS